MSVVEDIDNMINAKKKEVEDKISQLGYDIIEQMNKYIELLTHRDRFDILDQGKSGNYIGHALQADLHRRLLESMFDRVIRNRE